MKLNPGKVLELLHNIETKGDASWRKLNDYVGEALSHDMAMSKGGTTEVTRRKEALKILKSADLHYEYSWVLYRDQYLGNGTVVFKFAQEYHINGLPLSNDNGRVSRLVEIFNRNSSILPHSNCEINQADINKAIATWRIKGKPHGLCRYTIGGIDFNAKLLLSALKILGVKEATINVKGFNAASIVLNGKAALIMPLRLLGQ